MANERITQSIIANQIATEWIEVLYQFRNTNFLKHERQDLNWQIIWSNENTWVWNTCRLALDYKTSDTCLERLWSWFYYIETNDWINTITKCPDDDNTWCNVDIASATGIIDNKYAICLSGGVRNPCPQWHEEWWDQSKYGKFYRTIHGMWIYNMATNETWGRLIVNTEDIESADAQEYRFCSRVAWRGWQWWEIEICSTMTNFIE